MRSKDATGLNEALRTYIQRKGLKTALDRASAVDDWPTIVGPQIARVTEPQGVSKDGILFVRVRSAAWMQELQLMSPQILKQLGQREKKIRRIMWSVA